MHWSDLLFILALVAAACAVSYFLLLRTVRQIAIEYHLKMADQLAALDGAIRAIETRLAEHHAAAELIAAAQSTAELDSLDDMREIEGSETLAPDIHAVIAASAVAALGQNVHIRSIKPATSSWSQQGRVLVQASHNARARR